MIGVNAVSGSVEVEVESRGKSAPVEYADGDMVGRGVRELGVIGLWVMSREWVRTTCGKLEGTSDTVYLFDTLDFYTTP